MSREDSVSGEGSGFGVAEGASPEREKKVQQSVTVGPGTA